MWSSSEAFLRFVQSKPYELAVSERDARIITALPVVERVFRAGSVIVEEERATRTHTFVASGWAFSYLAMANGHRVINDFLMRGDFEGAQQTADGARRTIQARTDVTVFEIDARRAAECPILAMFIFRLFARNSCVAAERLASISRRTPQQRLVRLFLEIAHRHEQADLGSLARFEFPFTQRDLGDALGLTAIHINRLLRLLRDQGSLRFQHRTVELPSRPALARATDFNPGYIHFPD